MILNQWYGVLESREVKKGRLIGVTRMGEKMVAWRDQNGKVILMSDLCPHIGASLCQGKLVENRLACPFHGFEYDSSGQCKYVPALGKTGAVPKSLKVRTYHTFEAHGIIWLWWGEGEPDPVEPKWFDIDDSFSSSSFTQHWPVHYSRMVENQLDVMHLPFVHTTTIGRGQRVVVDGPLIRLEDNTMNIWVFNRKDDGVPPRKADELPEPKRPPFLVFNFPNVWENRISEDLRITAVFAPVDEGNTIIYLRFYQRFVRVPVVRDIVNFFGNLSNTYILNQDRRIVLRQRPIKTELKKMGEKLMPGDRAILTFRQHRHELKEKAGQFEHEK